MKPIRLYLRKSFTIIEILLVLSLLSMTSIAVYKALASGLAIWERRSRTQVYEDILVSFEKITEDLQKAVNFSKIPFNGKKEGVSFAAIIKTPVDRFVGREDAYTEQIGQVDYYFDETKKALIRHQRNYSQALNKKRGSERALVRGLESVRFTYFYKKNGTYAATDEFSDAVPAVFIATINFLEDGKKETVSRTVIIPLGTSE